jgi:hypothetical protein
MTTLRIWDFEAVFEVVKDKAALELVQRVIQAEVTFHEARLAQLKGLDQAIGKRVKQLG